MAPQKDSARFVTGYHAIEEYIQSLRQRSAEGSGAVLHTAAENKRTIAILSQARAAGISVRKTDTKSLDSLPVGADHRGLVLEIRAASAVHHTTFEAFLASFSAAAAPQSAADTPAEASLVLALDGVTDVHNLGALVRSADLFSAGAVIFPGRGSAKDSDMVAKISSGASAFVPLFEVTNLVRSLELLKAAGFWIYGADMDGTNAAETNLAGNTALVLGSEGKGLSRLVRETCDQLVRIPTRGHIDSFKVSVAGGILMYEVRRQQGWLSL
jgi:23S rRNA (guanosine2251-2'-O)-methyltransferase